MNDTTTFAQDMYPLVKERFNLRLKSRMDPLTHVIGVVEQDQIDYRLEGVGGFGELPVYNGTTIARADQKRGYITVINPQEHAIGIDVSFRKAKLDMSGEAAKIGTRLADSCHMTVLNDFYRLMQRAYTDRGADGVSWAAVNHPVNNEPGCDTLSNLVDTELSVQAICDAMAQGARFVTFDGLPFAANFDLLLVSPELEGKAKEICGPNGRLIPDHNPDKDTLGANPLYGMKYMVVGGGGIGFSKKQWAIADSFLFKEVVKLIYITKPTVRTEAKQANLIVTYVGYVDYGYGYGDFRPIIFSNPA